MSIYRIMQGFIFSSILLVSYSASAHIFVGHPHTNYGNTIHKPFFGGLRLNYCYHTRAGCGFRAADAYCRMLGYRNVNAFRIDRHVGPTRSIGSGRSCTSEKCSGFRWIRCEARRLYPADLQLQGADKIFYRPLYQGYRVNWCFGWNEGCGSVAAHAFCNYQGYAKALAYKVWENAGFSAWMQDGSFCRSYTCDSFRWIRCIR